MGRLHDDPLWNTFQGFVAIRVDGIHRGRVRRVDPKSQSIALNPYYEVNVQTTDLCF
jgi:hypothetical protein